MLTSEQKEDLVNKAVRDAWVEDARETYLPRIVALHDTPEQEKVYDDAFHVARAKYFACNGRFPTGENRVTLAAQLLKDAG